MSKGFATAPCGISGLDDVLNGGLTPEELYLIEGVPGSGKTTLGMQFLMEGARRGESTMYVSLSETESEIRLIAESHGWNLDGVHLREFTTSAEALAPGEHYTIFHPAEVELGTTMSRILGEVEALQPLRVVFDSLSELRLIAGSSLAYRRQILGLKHHFAKRACTVLLLDDLTSSDHDLQLQSIAHGVITLDQLVPTYGSDRRRLRVTKMRGRHFRGGFHDYVIRRGGLDVFPRLVAAEHRHESRRDRILSGIPGLDALMGGGLERGTSTLIQGAPGAGKSTIAAVFAHAATRLGEHAALFIFDEGENTLLTRMAGIGLDLRESIASGRMSVQQVDPAELSPGEFAHALRTAVEVKQAQVIVIDSLNGYLNSMPEERFLVTQLHEILMYLGQMGVATILIGAQTGLIGSNMQSPVDVSYLADNVMLMRYYEFQGEVRQAISVVKQRAGAHERTIRDFRISEAGVGVGEPLRQFRGVLTGVPQRDDSPA
ncbi:MAG TPA: ATPase domain-containing protein [Nevskiaceae bacterium]|nr:ATPase domain-containing protein [Nevskiaceae bacterium]